VRDDVVTEGFEVVRRSGATIGRRAEQLALGGLVGVIIVAIAGFAIERTRLGSTDQEAVARVESDVRAAFARMAGALEQMARPLAGRPDLLLDAAAGNHEAARTLFNDASAIITQYADGDLAITVYAPDGTPIAWSGRPSELPPDRLGGPQSLFVAPGPVGLRLVHLQPVTSATSAGGRRIGGVATEELLSARRGVGAVADRFTFDTALAPVLLRPRYESAGQSAGPNSFIVRSPSGDPLLEAQVSVADLARVRQQWRRTVAGAALAVVAVTLLLLAAPLLTLRNRGRTTGAYAGAAAGLTGIVLAARALLWFAVPSHWSATSLFSPSTFASGMLGPLLRSPVDLFVTALALLALVALAGDALERLRLAGRGRRHAVRPGADLARFAVIQLGVGAAGVLLTLSYELFLGDTFTNAGLDILHFSIHPLDVARLALVLGLLLFDAAVLWVSALVLRAGLHGWRLPRSPSVVRLLAAVLWATPVAIASVFVFTRGWPVPLVPWLFAVVVVGLAARFGSRVGSGFRHASQAARLLLVFLALLVPGAVMYPSLVYYAQQAKQRVIEREFAPQVMNQREELQVRVKASMDEIDRLRSLPDLVEAAPPSPGAPMPTDSAFLIWSQTDLAVYRVASAVELYGPDGSLVSRFALNLPEYTSTAQTWKEARCEWDLFDEVSPFGSEERQLLHAGLGICRGTKMVGSIVIHVILDYNTLPFISSQSPYFELLRSTRGYPREGTLVPDVDFIVYGWSRRSIYTSGTAAWPLTERTFARIYASRQPFWARIRDGGTSYEVYFLNDRAGIYALGYPVISPMGHLINLAELATLAAVAYVLMLAAAVAFRLLTGHRPGAGRALLREIRASFYRKLFLAFVAASVVPVLTLAFVARAYIANRLLADVRSTATRTSAVAQRVIEDYATLQQRGATTVSRLDDDVMLWISRVIGQDVNIFERVRLLATSERDLFASGLLPTRTPADVYRAIVLQRLPSFIGEEQAGDFRYLLAAAPVRFGAREAILTVPLTLRQHEIEREIDDLNRRIVLGAVLFILIGAGIGYPMAERIADPVNRLTRATRRIARGDLNARIAATSSDELRRLVEAFNSMAAELARQRDQLERTHRLEAWAEMARQVAHEIKNPLTPIQLSAEHLQRVSHDRGEPLSPVLDECIESILSQVRLLRQIAGEFSSFASSPTPRPTPTFVGDLLEEVVKPYRSALSGRIIFSVEIDPALPPLLVDRTLLGRGLTNIIDNSLHAMPGAGTLSVAATFHEQPARQVRIRVCDTGIGMDADALSRLFEPYFSTKAVGTGLGLTIAKRNVELNGGSIAIESEKGKGTTVTIVLPVDGAAPSGETS
jgi:signal transduction histidine kinase